MSRAYIQRELKQRGEASVLAILKPEYQTGEHVARLQECFQPSAHHPKRLRRAGAGMSADQPRGPADRGSPMLYLPNLGVAYGYVNPSGWNRLQREVEALSEVTGAAPLRAITGLGSTLDVAAAPEISWGIQKIGAPALWAKGLTGKGVLIAHLDTGVNGMHAALKDAIEAFALFDATGEIVPDAPTEDSADHGTHTAGTIAGREVNGRRIGVAPGCRLLCGGVIDGGDVVARLLAGVNWALGFPIKVLNLSLGFKGHHDHYIPLLKTIRAKGILPVFSSGNDGPKTSFAPGNYPDAMSVGAVDASGKVDKDSSSERFRRQNDQQVPDLVMPGVDIISADAPSGLFRADSGTSMAAPHASGLAALLWEACPEATVDEVESAIYGSCSRAKTMPQNRAGRGFPDAEKALAALEAQLAAVPRKQASRVDLATG